MKIKTRMIAVILSVISIVGVCCMFSGCQTEAERAEANSFTDGYFKYYYIKQTDSYAIVGDGDVPYPETLVIPAYYNGKEVTDVYYYVSTGLMFGKYLGPSLLGVETVWFPYTFFSASTFFTFVNEYYNLASLYGENELGSPKKYFFVETEHMTRLSSIPKGGSYPKELYFTSLYYKSFVYDTTDKYDYIYEWKDGTGCYQIANTSYMFNYEGAPNDGYFFINDFERGGLIEDTPYEPQREGYTFGGWYKEPECINKWDFVQDKLPEATYDEAGYVTDFVETKLYAAWIQN